MSLRSGVENPLDLSAALNDGPGLLLTENSLDDVHSTVIALFCRDKVLQQD